MGAWIEALAFLSAKGFDLESPAFDVAWWVRHLAEDMKLAAQEVRSGNFATSEATIAVNAAALRKWCQVFVHEGHRAEIMRAALRNLDAAQVAGFGEESWAAQAKVLFAAMDPAPQEPTGESTE